MRTRHRLSLQQLIFHPCVSQIESKKRASSFEERYKRRPSVACCEKFKSGNTRLCAFGYERNSAFSRRISRGNLIGIRNERLDSEIGLRAKVDTRAKRDRLTERKREASRGLPTSKNSCSYCSVVGKSLGGTGQGQEGSFAWTAYSRFRRFVDNRDTTRCYTVVEELKYEYSKMKIKIILSIYLQLIL